MRSLLKPLIAFALALSAAPALADAVIDVDRVSGGGGAALRTMRL